MITPPPPPPPPPPQLLVPLGIAQMVSYDVRMEDGKMGALTGLHVLGTADEQSWEGAEAAAEQSVQHKPEPPLMAAVGSLIHASTMAPVGIRMLPDRVDTTTSRSPPPGIVIRQPDEVLPLYVLLAGEAVEPQ